MSLVGGFPGKAPGGKRPLVSSDALQREGRSGGDPQGKAVPARPESEHCGLLNQWRAAEKGCRGIMEMENQHSFNSLSHIWWFRPLFHLSSGHKIDKNVVHTVYLLVESQVSRPCLVTLPLNRKIKTSLLQNLWDSEGATCLCFVAPSYSDLLSLPRSHPSGHSLFSTQRKQINTTVLDFLNR